MGQAECRAQEGVMVEEKKKKQKERGMEAVQRGSAAAVFAWARQGEPGAAEAWRGCTSSSEGSQACAVLECVCRWECCFVVVVVKSQQRASRVTCSFFAPLFEGSERSREHFAASAPQKAVSAPPPFARSFSQQRRSTSTSQTLFCTSIHTPLTPFHCNATSSSMYSIHTYYTHTTYSKLSFIPAFSIGRCCAQNAPPSDRHGAFPFIGSKAACVCTYGRQATFGLPTFAIFRSSPAVFGAGAKACEALLDKPRS